MSCRKSFQKRKRKFPNMPGNDTRVGKHKLKQAPKFGFRDPIPEIHYHKNKSPERSERQRIRENHPFLGLPFFG